MIRNLLYSIFFHIVIVFAVYFGIETIDLDLENNEQSKKILVSITPSPKPEIVDTKKNIKKPEKKEPIKPVKKIDSIDKVKEPSPKIRKKPKPKLINKATNIAAKNNLSNSQDLKNEIIFDPDKIYLEKDRDNDIDSLLLLSTHKRAIKTQLNFCFQNILKDQDIKKEIVKTLEVTFQLTRSGVLKFDIDKNFDKNLLNDEKYHNYKKIVQKIEKKAKNCAIFRNLPFNRYHIWKEFNVLFK